MPTLILIPRIMNDTFMRFESVELAISAFERLVIALRLRAAFGAYIVQRPFHPGIIVSEFLLHRRLFLFLQLHCFVISQKSILIT